MRGMETEGETTIVKELQAALFPVCPKGAFLSDLLQTSLKTTQLEISTDWRTQKSVAKLKEPRDLFALKKEPCAQQAARWPVECQVLEEPIEHISVSPSTPEHYYVPTGRELQPKPVGEDAGTVIFEYNPTTAVTYFSRSAVGGMRVENEPQKPIKDDTSLQFESRFESGNLGKAVKVTDTYYELYLRTDLYTNRHMQWFYFQIKNTRAKTMYRLSIVNLSKPESLYSCGMKPLMYSNKKAQLKRVGWHRIGDNIAYFRNDIQIDEEEGSAPCFTLTFTVEFPYDDDVIYLAHCYPYTYSTLQDYLLTLQNHPVKSTYTKLRLLCRSLAGNNVYYLTITEPSQDDNKKKRPAVVLTARVHPGETPASFMMKGIIDFLTGNSEPAKELRHKFIFKIIPMLNPDGVIVGNNRCSLTGRDLNRQYRTVIRETYPPVWHTKVLLRRLSEDCGIALYCDLHAHSRRHNIFIYGCESRRASDQPLQEQVFPLMMRKNAPDKFCFESCKFRIQRSKEGTGRVVVWMMGVPTSYTIEASFGGSTLGSRADTHFSMADYEGLGRTFCETLLDFSDDEPSKERLRAKIIDRLLKEGSSADEPTNINLSDYSSDEGDTSSCSEEDEEEGRDRTKSNLRQAWSVCVAEESQVSTSNSRQHSPEKLSPKSVRAHLGVDRVSPVRQSLPMSCATLDLPDSEATASCIAAASEEEGGVMTGSPTTTSHRRHRSREWARRVSSPARESLNRPRNMPPELIVTQAQVYEACIEVSEKICKEVVTTESISLPCISKRAPSTRPHTGDPHVDRHRSTSWQQMRSIPVYRAYYESHRVLVQRQAVEERMTSSSPTHGVTHGVTQGQMWGLQPPPPPRTKPKLQRQKSRKCKKEEAPPKEEDNASSSTPVPLAESKSKKGKLRSKFKKSSLVTIAVSQCKSEQNKNNVNPIKSANKSTSVPKNSSPSKRKNKKLSTRVQSTDF